MALTKIGRQSGQKTRGPDTAPIPGQLELDDIHVLLPHPVGQERFEERQARHEREHRERLERQARRALQNEQLRAALHSPTGRLTYPTAPRSPYTDAVYTIDLDTGAYNRVTSDTPQPRRNCGNCRDALRPPHVAPCNACFNSSNWTARVYPQAPAPVAERPSPITSAPDAPSCAGCLYANFLVTAEPCATCLAGRDRVRFDALNGRRPLPYSDDPLPVSMAAGAPDCDDCTYSGVADAQPCAHCRTASDRPAFLINATAADDADYSCTTCRHNTQEIAEDSPCETCDGCDIFQGWELVDVNAVPHTCNTCRHCDDDPFTDDTSPCAPCRNSALDPTDDAPDNWVLSNEAAREIRRMTAYQARRPRPAARQTPALEPADVSPDNGASYVQAGRDIHLDMETVSTQPLNRLDPRRASADYIEATPRHGDFVNIRWSLPSALERARSALLGPEAGPPNDPPSTPQAADYAVLETRVLERAIDARIPLDAERQSPIDAYRQVDFYRQAISRINRLTQDPTVPHPLASFYSVISEGGHSLTSIPLASLLDSTGYPLLSSAHPHADEVACAWVHPTNHRRIEESVLSILRTHGHPLGNMQSLRLPLNSPHPAPLPRGNAPLIAPPTHIPIVVLSISSVDNHLLLATYDGNLIAAYHWE